MTEQKEKRIQVETENLAVPEVKIHGYQELSEEEITACIPENKKVDINYNVAVPEVRINSAAQENEEEEA